MDIVGTIDRLELLVHYDPDSWAVEFGTAGFASFENGILFLVSKLEGHEFTIDFIKEELAKCRNEGQVSLYERFVKLGQRIFFPPNRARGGAAPFNIDGGDLTNWFIPTCYYCPGEPATFRMMPCKCNCICRRCATEIKLGSWTRCAICGSKNRGSVKHI